MIHNLKPYPAYKDSGVPWLGEVPAHWEVQRLKELLVVVKSWTIQKEQRLYLDVEGTVGKDSVFVDFMKRISIGAKLSEIPEKTFKSSGDQHVRWTYLWRRWEYGIRLMSNLSGDLSAYPKTRWQGRLY